MEGEGVQSHLAQSANYSARSLSEGRRRTDTRGDRHSQCAPERRGSRHKRANYEILDAFFSLWEPGFALS
jgi:hypothetical protein